LSDVKHHGNAIKVNFTSYVSTPKAKVSQPYFWRSERMTFTLPKWGLGSPLGLPKFQSSIAGVKTPHIEVLFISLESYRSVNVENGLA
jgi:hypothetical protein